MHSGSQGRKRLLATPDLARRLAEVDGRGQPSTQPHVIFGNVAEVLAVDEPQDESRRVAMGTAEETKSERHHSKDRPRLLETSDTGFKRSQHALGLAYAGRFVLTPGLAAIISGAGDSQTEALRGRAADDVFVGLNTAASYSEDGEGGYATPTDLHRDDGSQANLQGTINTSGADSMRYGRSASFTITPASPLGPSSEYFSPPSFSMVGPNEAIIDELYSAARTFLKYELKRCTQSKFGSAELFSTNDDSDMRRSALISKPFIARVLEVSEIPCLRHDARSTYLAALALLREVVESRNSKLDGHYDVISQIMQRRLRVWQPIVKQISSILAVYAPCWQRSYPHYVISKSPTNPSASNRESLTPSPPTNGPEIYTQAAWSLLVNTLVGSDVTTEFLSILDRGMLDDSLEDRQREGTRRILVPFCSFDHLSEFIMKRRMMRSFKSELSVLVTNAVSSLLRLRQTSTVSNPFYAKLKDHCDLPELHDSDKQTLGGDMTSLYFPLPLVRIARSSIENVPYFYDKSQSWRDASRSRLEQYLLMSNSLSFLVDSQAPLKPDDIDRLLEATEDVACTRALALMIETEFGCESQSKLEALLIEGCVSQSGYPTLRTETVNFPVLTSHTLSSLCLKLDETTSHESTSRLFSATHTGDSFGDSGFRDEAAEWRCEHCARRLDPAAMTTGLNSMTAAVIKLRALAAKSKRAEAPASSQAGSILSEESHHLLYERLGEGFDSILDRQTPLASFTPPDLLSMLGIGTQGGDSEATSPGIAVRPFQSQNMSKSQQLIASDLMWTAMGGNQPGDIAIFFLEFMQFIRLAQAIYELGSLEQVESPHTLLSNAVAVRQRSASLDELLSSLNLLASSVIPSQLGAFALLLSFLNAQFRDQFGMLVLDLYLSSKDSSYRRQSMVKKLALVIQQHLLHSAPTEHTEHIRALQLASSSHATGDPLTMQHPQAGASSQSNTRLEQRPTKDSSEMSSDSESGWKIRNHGDPSVSSDTDGFEKRTWRGSFASTTSSRKSISSQELDFGATLPLSYGSRPPSRNTLERPSSRPSSMRRSSETEDRWLNQSVSPPRGPSPHTGSLAGVRYQPGASQIFSVTELIGMAQPNHSSRPPLGRPGRDSVGSLTALLRRQSSTSAQWNASDHGVPTSPRSTAMMARRFSYARGIARLPIHRSLLRCYDARALLSVVGVPLVLNFLAPQALVPKQLSMDEIHSLMRFFSQTEGNALVPRSHAPSASDLTSLLAAIATTVANPSGLYFSQDSPKRQEVIVKALQVNTTDLVQLYFAQDKPTQQRNSVTNAVGLGNPELALTAPDVWLPIHERLALVTPLGQPLHSLLPKARHAIDDLTRMDQVPELLKRLRQLQGRTFQTFPALSRTLRKGALKSSIFTAREREGILTELRSPATTLFDWSWMPGYVAAKLYSPSSLLEAMHGNVSLPAPQEPDEIVANVDDSAPEVESSFGLLQEFASGLRLPGAIPPSLQARGIVDGLGAPSNTGLGTESTSSHLSNAQQVSLPEFFPELRFASLVADAAISIDETERKTRERVDCFIDEASIFGFEAAVLARCEEGLAHIFPPERSREALPDANAQIWMTYCDTLPDIYDPDYGEVPESDVHTDGQQYEDRPTSTDDLDRLTSIVYESMKATQQAASQPSRSELELARQIMKQQASGESLSHQKSTVGERRLRKTLSTAAIGQPWASLGHAATALHDVAHSMVSSPATWLSDYLGANSDASHAISRGLVPPLSRTPTALVVGLAEDMSHATRVMVNSCHALSAIRADALLNCAHAAVLSAVGPMLDEQLDDINRFLHGRRSTRHASRSHEQARLIQEHAELQAKLAQYQSGKRDIDPTLSTDSLEELMTSDGVDSGLVDKTTVLEMLAQGLARDVVERDTLPNEEDTSPTMNLDSIEMKQPSPNSGSELTMIGYDYAALPLVERPRPASILTLTAFNLLTRVLHTKASTTAWVTVNESLRTWVYSQHRSIVGQVLDLMKRGQKSASDSTDAKASRTPRLSEGQDTTEGGRLLHSLRQRTELATGLLAVSPLSITGPPRGSSITELLWLIELERAMIQARIDYQTDQRRVAKAGSRPTREKIGGGAPLKSTLGRDIYNPTRTPASASLRWDGQRAAGGPDERKTDLFVALENCDPALITEELLNCLNALKFQLAFALDQQHLDIPLESFLGRTTVHQLAEKALIELRSSEHTISPVPPGEPKASATSDASYLEVDEFSTTYRHLFQNIPEEKAHYSSVTPSTQTDASQSKRPDAIRNGSQRENGAEPISDCQEQKLAPKYQPPSSPFLFSEKQIMRLYHFAALASTSSASFLAATALCSDADKARSSLSAPEAKVDSSQAGDRSRNRGSKTSGNSTPLHNLKSLLTFARLHGYRFASPEHFVAKAPILYLLANAAADQLKRRTLADFLGGPEFRGFIEITQRHAHRYSSNAPDPLSQVSGDASSPIGAAQMANLSDTDYETLIRLTGSSEATLIHLRHFCVAHTKLLVDFSLRSRGRGLGGSGNDADTYVQRLPQPSASMAFLKPLLIEAAALSEVVVRRVCWLINSTYLPAVAAVRAWTHYKNLQAQVEESTSFAATTDYDLHAGTARHSTSLRRRRRAIIVPRAKPIPNRGANNYYNQYYTNAFNAMVSSSTSLGMIRTLEALRTMGSTKLRMKSLGHQNSPPSKGSTGMALTSGSAPLTQAFLPSSIYPRGVFGPEGPFAPLGNMATLIKACKMFQDGELEIVTPTCSPSGAGQNSGSSGGVRFPKLLHSSPNRSGAKHTQPSIPLLGAPTDPSAAYYFQGNGALSEVESHIDLSSRDDQISLQEIYQDLAPLAIGTLSFIPQTLITGAYAPLLPSSSMTDQFLHRRALAKLERRRRLLRFKAQKSGTPKQRFTFEAADIAQSSPFRHDRVLTSVSPAASQPYGSRKRKKPPISALDGLVISGSAHRVNAASRQAAKLLRYHTREQRRARPSIIPNRSPWGDVGSNSLYRGSITDQYVQASKKQQKYDPHSYNPFAYYSVSNASPAAKMGDSQESAEVADYPADVNAASPRSLHQAGDDIDTPRTSVSSVTTKGRPSYSNRKDRSDVDRPHQKTAKSSHDYPLPFSLLPSETIIPGRKDITKPGHSVVSGVDMSPADLMPSSFTASSLGTESEGAKDGLNPGGDANREEDYSLLREEVTLPTQVPCSNYQIRLLLPHEAVKLSVLSGAGLYTANCLEILLVNTIAGVNPSLPVPKRLQRAAEAIEKKANPPPEQEKVRRVRPMPAAATARRLSGGSIGLHQNRSGFAALHSGVADPGVEQEESLETALEEDEVSFSQVLDTTPGCPWTLEELIAGVQAVMQQLSMGSSDATQQGSQLTSNEEASSPTSMLNPNGNALNSEQNSGEPAFGENKGGLYPDSVLVHLPTSVIEGVNSLKLSPFVPQPAPVDLLCALHIISPATAERAKSTVPSSACPPINPSADFQSVFSRMHRVQAEMFASCDYLPACISTASLNRTTYSAISGSGYAASYHRHDPQKPGQVHHLGLLSSYLPASVDGAADAKVRSVPVSSAQLLHVPQDALRYGQSNPVISPLEVPVPFPTCDPKLIDEAIRCTPRLLNARGLGLVAQGTFRITPLGQQFGFGVGTTALPPFGSLLAVLPPPSAYLSPATFAAVFPDAAARLQAHAILTQRSLILRRAGLTPISASESDSLAIPLTGSNTTTSGKVSTPVSPLPDLDPLGSPLGSVSDVRNPHLNPSLNKVPYSPREDVTATYSGPEPVELPTANAPPKLFAKTLPSWALTPQALAYNPYAQTARELYCDDASADYYDTSLKISRAHTMQSHTNLGTGKPNLAALDDGDDGLGLRSDTPFGVSKLDMYPMADPHFPCWTIDSYSMAEWYEIENLRLITEKQRAQEAKGRVLRDKLQQELAQKQRYAQSLLNQRMRLIELAITQAADSIDSSSYPSRRTAALTENSPELVTLTQAAVRASEIVSALSTTLTQLDDPTREYGGAFAKSSIDPPPHLPQLGLIQSQGESRRDYGQSEQPAAFVFTDSPVMREVDEYVRSLKMVPKTQFRVDAKASPSATYLGRHYNLKARLAADMLSYQGDLVAEGDDALSDSKQVEASIPDTYSSSPLSSPRSVHDDCEVDPDEESSLATEKLDGVAGILSGPIFKIPDLTIDVGHLAESALIPLRTYLPVSSFSQSTTQLLNPDVLDPSTQLPKLLALPDTPAEAFRVGELRAQARFNALEKHEKLPQFGTGLACDQHKITFTFSTLPQPKYFTDFALTLLDYVLLQRTMGGGGGSKPNTTSASTEAADQASTSSSGPVAQNATMSSHYNMTEYSGLSPVLNPFTQVTDIFEANERRRQFRAYVSRSLQFRISSLRQRLSSLQLASPNAAFGCVGIGTFLDPGARAELAGSAELAQTQLIERRRKAVMFLRQHILKLHAAANGESQPSLDSVDEASKAYQEDVIKSPVRMKTRRPTQSVISLRAQAIRSYVPNELGQRIIDVGRPPKQLDAIGVKPWMQEEAIKMNHLSPEGILSIEKGEHLTVHVMSREAAAVLAALEAARSQAGAVAAERLEKRGVGKLTHSIASNTRSQIEIDEGLLLDEGLKGVLRAHDAKSRTAGGHISVGVSAPTRYAGSQVLTADARDNKPSLMPSISHSLPAIAPEGTLHGLYLRSMTEPHKSVATVWNSVSSQISVPLPDPPRWIFATKTVRRRSNEDGKGEFLFVRGFVPSSLIHVVSLVPLLDEDHA